MSDGAREPRMPFVREPLLHFVLIALAAFAIRAAITPPESEVVIDQALVEGLRRVGGVGSGAEQSDSVLVDAWLRDELLFREALALGLERGDEIVRRRLVLKMETILSVVDEEPSEDDLQAYLAAHPADFATAANLSLEHVFFSRDRRDDAQQDALEAQFNDAPQGDAFMLGARELRRTPEILDQRFGGGFGQGVAALSGEGWLGPVESRYGWHLVRITERNAASSPQLDAVRGLVEAEWREQRREENLQAAVDALRARTRIERRVDTVP